jgi:hypothetical protein
MPLILQAANRGQAVIPIQIPDYLQRRWERWVETISPVLDGISFGVISDLFDGPYHLPANIQNAILQAASPILAQEIQLFLDNLIRDLRQPPYQGTSRNTKPVCLSPTHAPPIVSRDTANIFPAEPKLMPG